MRTNLPYKLKDDALLSYMEMNPEAYLSEIPPILEQQNLAIDTEEYIKISREYF